MVSAMGERDPAIVDEVVELCLSYAGPIQTHGRRRRRRRPLARAFSRCGVRATLFDRPAVIPVAREYLGEEGRGHRPARGGLHRGSAARARSIWSTSATCCHIYGPVTNARVIREAFSIVSPGGVIAIQDYVWGRSPRAAMFAVNMLQATDEGGVWSEAQVREWLSDAGFAKIEMFDLRNGAGPNWSSPHGLAEGRWRTG